VLKNRAIDIEASHEKRHTSAAAAAHNSRRPAGPHVGVCLMKTYVGHRNSQGVAGHAAAPTMRAEGPNMRAA
jgi:hypothetical protein